MTFQQTGLPNGTTWAVTLGNATLNSTGTAIAFEEPNGTYDFRIVSPGFQPTPGNGTLTVSGGAIDQPIQFVRVTYNVTFIETGLPAGTVWTVTLGGNPLSSGYSEINFSEGNGSYSYRISSPGFQPTPGSGVVNVSGALVRATIAFTPVVYSVTFVESGTPENPSVSWGVALGAVNRTAPTTQRSLAFSVANGTYPFTARPLEASFSLPPYRVSPSNGSVQVDGASLEIAIRYTLPYVVSFAEGGLPAGTLWSITLNGTANESTSNEIGFFELNGSYPYTVGAVPKFTAAPTSGTIPVLGGNVSQSVAFSLIPVPYSVTFTQTGLPGGVPWWVNLTTGPSFNSTSATLTFAEPNGSYTFRAATANKTYTAPGGTFEVTGTPVQEGVTFVRVTFPITFQAIGLPTSTNWSVAVDGSTENSTGPSIVFAEPNGTYSFVVAVVPGHSAQPASGPVRVAGAATYLSVTFTSTAGGESGSSEFLGLPGNTGFYLVAGIGSAVVIAVGVILLRRSSRH